MAVILDQYAQFSKIPGLVRSATDALDNFNQLSAPGARSLKDVKLQQDVASISKNDPQAGAAAQAMIGQMHSLEDTLPGLAQEISKQSIVVANYTSKLDAANKNLDEQNALLDKLKGKQTFYADQIEAAKSAIQDYANTPIQGSAADLCKLAMLQIDRELPKVAPHARMLLQVHDELVFEVPEAEVAATTELARRVMERPHPLDVPLEVGIGVGQSWGDAH